MKGSRKRKIAAVCLMVAMMITMMPFSAFAGEAVDIEWYNFRNNPENNGVVDKTTPISAETAGLKWAEKYDEGSSFFVSTSTPPLILDGYLYVGFKDKVYKIDKKTGKKIAESDSMVSSVGFAMNPITYADGKLFVQVGNGIVQAIDYETLKCVWSTEKIGGQTVSPISHVEIDGKGYLYTGTWNSPSADGAFMCVSTDDSNVNEDKIKKAEWRFIPSGDALSLKEIVYGDTPLSCDEDIKAAIAGGTAQKRGFYWAGAYACDKFIAVGSDDGSNDYGEPAESACFYTLNPKTGEIIDKISNIKGDIRTSVVYDKGSLYFSTKGGRLYKVAVDENGKLGKAETLDLGGEVTSTPVVYNGRAYLGVCGDGGQFDPKGGHSFAVVDSESMTKLYDLPISGYPQASALLSTAYENEDFDGDGKADGRVYLYFTYNANPGGIYYTYDAKEQKNAASECGELFVPDTDKQNYCISTICTDDDGVLYYKNDSGYLMAVQNLTAYISDAEVSGALSWNREFTPGVTEYEVIMAAGTKSANIKLKLPANVSAYCEGKLYDSSKGLEVNLDENGRAKVVIKAVFSGQESESLKNTPAGMNQGEENVTEYTINIRCIGTDSSLSNLKVSGSNTPGEEEYSLSPAFSAGTLKYTADIRDSEKSFYNIWPEISDEKGAVKLFAEKNVDPAEINEDGTIRLASGIEGNDRYAVYPADKTKNVEIRIEVTSESGDRVTEYNVTLLKETAGTIAPGDDEGQTGDKGNSEETGSSSDVSKTGDLYEPAVWITVLAIAAIMLTAVFTASKMRKRE